MPKGVRVTVQGKRNHVTKIAERHGPARPALLLDRGRARTTGTTHDRSDYQACRDGYVSVTPLQPDMTAHAGAPGWLGQLDTD